MVGRNLAHKVAHSNRDLSREHRFAVFRNPYQVHLEVTLRVRSKSVASHMTELHDNILRLKARGFTIPDGDTNDRQFERVFLHRMGSSCHSSHSRFAKASPLGSNYRFSLRFTARCSALASLSRIAFSARWGLTPTAFASTRTMPTSDPLPRIPSQAGCRPPVEPNPLTWLEGELVSGNSR